MFNYTYFVSFFSYLFNVQVAHAGAPENWPSFHNTNTNTGYTTTGPATNEIIWDYTTGSNVESSPAVANGVMYVGSNDSKVYAFGTPITHTVSFVESGLTAGTGRSVTFDGTLKSSTTNTITFTAQDGNYGYSVSTPSGYSSSSQLTGTITVDNSDVTKNIAFTKIVVTPPTTNYDLTIYVTGNGTVTPTNSTFTAGTKITLTATSQEGWTFTGWSGDATGTEDPTIVMDSNKTVTANFTQDPTEYTLTILVVGNGTATPTTGTYAAGTSVPLQATSAQGWTFAGWSGDATGLTNTTIVMNSDSA